MSSNHTNHRRFGHHQTILINGGHTEGHHT